MRIEEGTTERWRSLFVGNAHRVAQLTLQAGEEMTEHRAPHHLFLCVWSGELTLTINGEDVRLRPGDCVNLTPGTPHAVRANQDSIALLVLIAEEKSGF
ncbi:cupin domain-containing protein [Alicyclobacillus fructus]|uniref:cupin domain-containing protein n=1 Tax=Alicyclobacillus fructus TaxID=2816082 RepID=UPI001A8C8C4E|nr:cupin domain-containing protein [Alicyclobacillus fructus]